MGFVSKDMIERAREFTVLDYVLAYENSLYKKVGNGYRHIEHPSLAVSEKGFYWHSNGEIKGKTALDYLAYVHGYGLVDAVCTLLGEQPHERGDKLPTEAIKPKARPPTAPSNKNSFTAPIRNKDNRRVIAYLQSRGIDRDLIVNCINQGSLYESLPYHNAVFTGKDENGKTRFAALRGITSGFKSDVSGSDKKYGFVLPPDNPKSYAVACFEAPIDCLSHQTLCKQGFIESFDGWRLSLGGTSLLSLEHFLETHTEVTHCLICTDKDEAGELAAAKIADLRGIMSERSSPMSANDWNDMLQNLQKEERTQNRTRRNTPEL